MAPLIPTLAAHARSILSSAVATRTQAVQTASEHLSQVGPLAARAILLGRDDDNKDSDKGSNPPMIDPSVGVTDPNNINNVGIFVLFGLIGVAFVVTGIWFFFWAKNGGFYFKENDWEDYKSTVLRRKGPNGTLLSNATPSTNLGGGSVYKDVDDGATEYTGGLTQMTGETGDTVSTLSGITAGPSDIGGRERRRQQREKKEREREKRRDKRKNRRKVGEDGVLVDEEAEADAKRNLRAYRHERAARVGGLNKEAEGSEWEGSTNPEMSTVSGSELLLNNRQRTPTKDKEKEKEKRRSKSKSRSGKDKQREETYRDDVATEMTYDTGSQVSQSNPGSSNISASTTNNDKTTGNTTRKAGGIRKVYSTADRTTTRENERLRAEARRLAEKGRAAAAASTISSSSGASASTSTSYYPTHRRDFSYQRADLRNPGNAIAEETGSLMGDHNNNNDNGGGRYLPAPGGWIPESADIADGGSSDLGTKSYRHYIPGISSSAAASSVDGSGGSEYTDGIRRERQKKREERRSRR
ncbi:hypothetical protein GGR55DRAFT_654085 [Xylaria sp. FL0064]|nr:hypothetical protein GGR55DRAFT_654085 [Xylaria sp. FL0064]